VSRGVSTVLDVAVCLLLVSAAVGTLAIESPSTDDRPAGADPTADALATSTVELRPAGDGRTAHGTPAGLLARSTARSATVDGRRLTPARPEFDAALANAIRRVASERAERTRVRAVWEPYPNATVAGRAAVGPEPPASADVDAAVVTVPLGAVDRTAPERAAARDGFRGVARLVARTVVRRAFPSGRSRRALLDGRERTTRRYRHAARTLGVDAERTLAAGNATRANRRLTAALADRVERDLRARYDRPAAAARALDFDAVRLTVRTWSV